MKKSVSLVIMLAFSLILINCASAAPTVYSQNGHYYDAISTPETITWDNANQAAKLMGGHLASITSQDENNFISGLIKNQNHNYWIGGYQGKHSSKGKPGLLQKPNQDWVWVTGEIWSYTNWSPNEPNDFGGANENKLIIYPDTGKWNDDLANSIYAYGFIIEYENGGINSGPQ